MPSERYIPPTAAEIRQWEAERDAKERFRAHRTRLIEAALRKLKKDDLINLLMSLDTYDPSVRWSIEAALSLKKPVDLIAHDLRHAIGIATKVEKELINRNFHYSWQAYEETERGFKALLVRGELDLVKEIALEFMKKASFQVACSDEGEMMEEIEACLHPVIQTLTQNGPELHRQWAADMSFADQTGCICCHALESLCKAN